MAHQSKRALSDWLIRHKKRICQIGTGSFLYFLYNLFYDLIFFPTMLVLFGYVVGGAIAVLGSLVQCSIMFWVYDRMGADWLGANMLRELEYKEQKNRFEKLATWFGKKKTGVVERIAAPFTFILLTAAVDPLVVAVHFKHSHFKGIAPKEWGLLLASVASANAWWLLKMLPVAAFVRFAFFHHF